jgi:hypothetical protein
MDHDPHISSHRHCLRCHYGDHGCCTPLVCQPPCGCLASGTVLERRRGTAACLPQRSGWGQRPTPGICRGPDGRSGVGCLMPREEIRSTRDGAVGPVAPGPGGQSTSQFWPRGTGGWGMGAGDAITKSEQIRETVSLKGDHGRDQCQEFQLLWVFGTDRPVGHQS